MNKRKSILLWIIIIFSLFFIFPAIFIAVSNSDFTSQSLLFYLFEDATNYNGISFEGLQTVYLTIFTCFIGIYFTVLGIVMSNLKVAFIDFFKFSSETDFVLFSIAIFAQFCEVVFILPHFPYFVLTELLLYAFIFFLLLFIIFAIFKMSVLQNYKECLKLFVRKALHSNEDKIREFYENFVCKCFPEKSVDILDDFYREMSSE